MKNNSFRNTFYLGLIIVLVLSGLITLISINIYRSFNGINSSKIKKDSSVVELPLEKEIVHDTIYLEKTPVASSIKPIDTPKQKKEIKVLEKTDTTRKDSVK